MKDQTAHRIPTFLTASPFGEQRSQGMIESPRGPLLIASCRSGTGLAGEVVSRYEALSAEAGSDRKVPYLGGVDFQFSDGETCVRLEQDVNGKDVYLFQALQDPTSERSVDQNYLAFLITLRAFREWGANRVTGVLPYLAYARQDQPTKFQREPTTVELMADLSIKAGLDRIVVWHPHMNRVHGFYGSVPVDALSSLALFQKAFARFQGREDVIAVAPDAGAAKFIMHFARAMDISSAVASKYRPRPEKAVISEIMGDFADKRIAILLDDMIHTGGTIWAAARKLVRDKGIEELYLGVSHNLCKEKAFQRLSALHEEYQLQQVVVTNSVPQTDAFQSLSFLTVQSLADPLCRVINRIHYNRSVGGMFAIPFQADYDERVGRDV
jgi:ribose-phosphate pyrophosphokinase